MVYPISVTKEIGWLQLILLKKIMTVYSKNNMKAPRTHSADNVQRSETLKQVVMSTDQDKMLKMRQCACAIFPSEGRVATTRFESIQTV
jgi:nicotinic acid mononucleotide adenylyltransferase